MKLYKRLHDVIHNMSSKYNTINFFENLNPLKTFFVTLLHFLRYNFVSLTSPMLACWNMRRSFASTSIGELKSVHNVKQQHVL